MLLQKLGTNIQSKQGEHRMHCLHKTSKVTHKLQNLVGINNVHLFLASQDHLPHKQKPLRQNLLKREIVFKLQILKLRVLTTFDVALLIFPKHELLVDIFIVTHVAEL